MGKAIIAIFFVAGFVIFIVIKYAATGVRAAYQAVNNPEGFRADLAAAQAGGAMRVGEAIIGALASQIMLMGAASPREIPREARDEWSLGYVAGFSIGVSRRSSGVPDAERVIPPLVYQFLFCQGANPLSYVDVLARVRIADKARNPTDRIHEGFVVGLREAAEWLDAPDEATSRVPLGWSEHYHQRTATALVGDR